jgi:RNA polymerase sigma factor (sigma-70 family)
MPPAPISDAALVQATARGDREAWRLLIERHDGLIRAICRAHRLTHADADDVRQTTWLRALEHAAGLRNPQGIAAWLGTVARRECLRVLRDRARVYVCEDALLEREGDFEPPADACVLAAERRAALRATVATLAARDRALLALLYDDAEPSYTEIGRTLAMPVGSIGPTRARMLERLRMREPLAGLAAAA